MSIKEPQVWAYPVYYLGGYSPSQRHRNGKLSIFLEPEKKLVFESYSLKFTIPSAKIQQALIDTEKFTDRNAVVLIGIPLLLADFEGKFLTVWFEDASGNKQKPRFQLIFKDEEEYKTVPEKVMNQINSLMPEDAKISSPREQQFFLNSQDSPKLFCKYCGSQNDFDANGAKVVETK
jgi:hypothetical protein